MNIIVKDVTGEIFSSAVMTKEAILEEVIAQGGDEDGARETYRNLVAAMHDWTSISNLVLNVGTPNDIQLVTFNPANLIYVEIVDPIDEWEEGN